MYNGSNNQFCYPCSQHRPAGPDWISIIRERETERGMEGESGSQGWGGRKDFNSVEIKEQESFKERKIILKRKMLKRTGRILKENRNF